VIPFKTSFDAFLNDKENAPLVSIILPVYNGERFLNRCLDSIYTQSFKDYELIIINDGSTDRTREILKEHEHKATVLHQENKGISKSINKGLRLAKGKFVCFIAHDDWFSPNKLEVELSYILNLDVGVVYDDFYKVIGNDITIIRVPEYDPRPLRRCDNYINVGATMIKKECLDKLKQLDGHFFDETLTSCMDGDLWIRLSHICEFKHIPLPLAYYYHHKNQISRSRKHIQDRYRLYRRYNSFSLHRFINVYLKAMLLWAYVRTRLAFKV